MSTEFEVQQTLQRGYEVLRAEATEDTELDLTTKGDFAQKPAGAVEIPANNAGGSVANFIQIIVCAGDAENEKFDWRLIGWRGDNGPAELIAEGNDAILGTQAVVKYPHSGNTATLKFWADTFVVDAYYWGKQVVAVDSGGNSVAKLVLDIFGYKWILFEITNASAGSATPFMAYWSYF